MRLSDALGLGSREIVALTGAGGKTSALYALARELLAGDHPVIATTTTHMRPPPAKAGWPLILGNDPRAQRAALSQALAEHGRAFLASAFTPEGKLSGIPPSTVPALAELADMVLVEADGARGHALKAPAEHEPVIPGAATLVVPVVGLQAIGRPIAEETVHRPERLAALLGAPAGALITPAMIAALLLAEQGGLQGVPAQARIVPLCNQADDAAHRQMGREVAATVLRAGGKIRRSVVGAVQTGPTDMEVWRPSVVIVLAAGAGRRFGHLKQAQEWQGRPLLLRAVAAALGSLATQVRVVLGCQAERLVPLLTGLHSPRLTWAVNPVWEEGIASSIRAGLAGLGATVETAIFCNADQPLLSSREIDALLARQALSDAPIVAPQVAGEQRSPVLFARRLFPELAALVGDSGGRSLIQRYPQSVDYVVMADPLPFADLDTVDDMQHLQDLLRGRRLDR